MITASPSALTADTAGANRWGKDVRLDCFPPPSRRLPWRSYPERQPEMASQAGGGRASLSLSSRSGKGLSVREPAPEKPSAERERSPGMAARRWIGERTNGRVRIQCVVRCGSWRSEPSSRLPPATSAPPIARHAAALRRAQSGAGASAPASRSRRSGSPRDDRNNVATVSMRKPSSGLPVIVLKNAINSPASPPGCRWPMAAGENPIVAGGAWVEPA